MFGIFIYDLLFFGIPLLSLALLGLSIYRFVAAKRANRKVPSTFSPSSVKRRKIIMIITAIITGLFLSVIIGFMSLLFLAAAFM